jgi:cell division protein FtsW
MGASFEAERIESGGSGDPGLLASVVLLAGCGVAVLWSASSGYALSLGRGPEYFALRQARYLIPAAALFWLCSMLPLESLRKRIGLVTLGGLAFLLLPFVPGLGSERNGASRWIDLGFITLQPSEFWKPVAIIYLAHVLDSRGRLVDGGSGPLIPPFLLASLGCIIVFAQNDFSTAVICFAACAAMFWIAGASIAFFLGLGAAAAPLAALSVLTSDFRLRRILAFVFPTYEPHGQGYQVLGSLKAIKAGGFFGKGLGLGTVKLGLVPEVQSDFVFAAFAEEAGFAGVLAFLALWGVFVWRAFRCSFAETDGFRSYLGFGLASLLTMEALVNVSVVAGLLPATGIALPFFSAGGSSLFSTAVSCGILYNLSKSASAPRQGRRASIFARSAIFAGPEARGASVGEDLNG